MTVVLKKVDFTRNRYYYSGYYDHQYKSYYASASVLSRNSPESMSERIIDHPISSAGPSQDAHRPHRSDAFCLRWRLSVWTTFPLLAGAMLLGAIAHPPIGRDSTCLFDFALAACLLVIRQAIPLPS